MAKKPKIEVDESLVKQVIAGQLPITTKVTRVIPEQIPSGSYGRNSRRTALCSGDRHRKDSG